MIKTLLTLYLPNYTLCKEMHMPYRLRSGDDLLLDGANDTYNLTVESDGCYELVQERLRLDVNLPAVFTTTPQYEEEVRADFVASVWGILGSSAD